MIIRKKCLGAFLTLLTVLALWPIPALAAGLISPDRDVTLRISYSDSGKAIPDAKFYVYKVADVDAYAHLTLTDEFAPYQNTVTGLSALESVESNAAWSELASTLKGIVQRDGLPETGGGSTNDDGLLSLTLKPGLYLVIGRSVTTDNAYTYTPTPFMLFLPENDAANNDWNYAVSVSPKFSKKYNPPDDDDDDITRKVLKKWDDAGYESIRPAQVTVQLLRDGKVYDTQTLSEENNWRYSWNHLDPDDEWTVVEKELKGYTVSITRSGITFTITNTRVETPPGETPPEEPVPPSEPTLPQTGILWWPVPLLLSTGFTCVLIGVIRRRKNDE